MVQSFLDANLTNGVIGTYGKLNISAKLSQKYSCPIAHPCKTGDCEAVAARAPMEAPGCAHVACRWICVAAAWSPGRSLVCMWSLLAGCGPMVVQGGMWSLGAGSGRQIQLLGWPAA